MSGHLYCFNTIENANIYKVGYTQQDIATRMRGYLGPSKPRIMVVTCKVDNVIDAERMMLQLCRHSNVLRPRDDMGNEWFQASDHDVEERHVAINFMSRVVQLAVRKIETIERNIVTPLFYETKHAEHTGALPGMQLYFVGLDRYLTVHELIGSSADIVSDFEKSDNCLIIPEYTRFSFSERLKAAIARHPFLERH